MSPPTLAPSLSSPLDMSTRNVREVPLTASSTYRYGGFTCPVWELLTRGGVSRDGQPPEKLFTFEHWKIKMSPVMKGNKTMQKRRDYLNRTDFRPVSHQVRLFHDVLSTVAPTFSPPHLSVFTVPTTYCGQVHLVCTQSDTVSGSCKYLVCNLPRRRRKRRKLLIS